MAKKNNSISNSPSGRDPFHALCLLASRESWCWDLSCSTCGQVEFRYAFRELVAGKHPDAPEWIVSRGKQPAFGKLLPAPPRGRWPLEEQQKLAGILTRTDLREIHEACRFPDWLGYLGLALATTEDAECLDRKLTLCLIPQLMELVQRVPSCVTRLTAILSDSDRILRWSHLEMVEAGIQGRNPPPRKNIPLIFDEEFLAASKKGAPQ